MVAFDKGHVPHCSRNFPLFSAENATEAAEMVRYALGEGAAARATCRDWYKRPRAKETLTFEAENAADNLKNLKTSDCGIEPDENSARNKKETELRDSCRLMNKFRTLEKQEINLYDQHKGTRAESVIKKREREQRRASNWNSAIKATFS